MRPQYHLDDLAHTRVRKKCQRHSATYASLIFYPHKYDEHSTVLHIKSLSLSPSTHTHRHIRMRPKKQLIPDFHDMQQ